MSSKTAGTTGAWTTRVTYSRYGSSMSNITDHRGPCPVPFLDESTFPNRGGNIASRLCIAVGPDLKCCLPCPAADWVYSPTLKRFFVVGGAMSAVGLACIAFLLVSWAVLPPEKTKRHAFGVCVTTGIGFICMAFIIGTSAGPSQCFDDITPNDLYTNIACAFSGSFVIAGAITVSTWIAVRASSMHLQVCWNIVPGDWFFYCTQALGWGVAGALFTLNITTTGVSYRFGPVCHINSHHALRQYWGPLFAMSGTAALFTLTTLTYSVYVYMKYHSTESSTLLNDSTDLSLIESSTTSARLIYQRVMIVLWLSWRSVVVIVFVLTDIAFYAAVYIKLDHIISAATDGTAQGLARVDPFLACLVEHQGERTKCYSEAGKALVSEKIALAALMLLSLAGIQCFTLLARTQMFTAWGNLFRKAVRRTEDSASVGAIPQLQLRSTASFDRGMTSLFEFCHLGTQQPDMAMSTGDREDWLSSVRPTNIVLEAPWTVLLPPQGLGVPHKNMKSATAQQEADASLYSKRLDDIVELTIHRNSGISTSGSDKAAEL